METSLPNTSLLLNAPRKKHDRSEVGLNQYLDTSILMKVLLHQQRIKVNVINTLYRNSTGINLKNKMQLTTLNKSV